MDADRPLLFEAQIDHEPASKANQRRLVRWGKRMVSIKSAKAIAFVEAMKREAVALPVLLTQDLMVDITIFYKSRKPDLDESIVLDALQGIAYVNDRQVKKKIVSWGVDPDFPKVIVKIYPLQEGDVPGYQRRRVRDSGRKERGGTMVGV